MAEFKRGNNFVEENKSGFDKVDNRSEDKKDKRDYSPMNFNNPTLPPKNNNAANRDDAEHVKHLMEAQSKLQKSEVSSRISNTPVHRGFLLREFEAHRRGRWKGPLYGRREAT